MPKQVGAADPGSTTPRRERALLAAIIANSDDAMISESVDGTILTWNATAERLFGYTAQEIIGSPITRLYASDRLPEAQELLSRLRAGDTISHYETQRLRKDGTPVDVSITVSPIRDAEGRVVAAFNIARGITKARQSQRYLELTAAIVEHSDDAIISMAPDGRVISWNAGAERLFGYAATEMIGESMARVFPADRAHEEPELIARLMAGETISHYQTRRIRKDGAAIDVSVTLSPIRDAHGAIVAVSRIVRDITAMKRQQSVLAQVSRDLQTILDESPVLIGAWNADLTNRFANKAYAATLGWSAADLRGRHIRDFLGTENFERTRARMEAALRGHPQGFDSSVRLPDGGLHHYHVEFVPEQQEDGSTGVLVFALDFTDRVLQDIALKKSELHTRSVLASMAEGLVVHALDGTVMDANAAASAVLGMSREQLLGRTSLDPSWEAIREDGSPLPGTEHPAMVALRSGQSLRNQVMGVQTLDNGRRWLSVNAQPLWTEDGAIMIGAIATFTDITEQRRQQLKAARFHEQIRSLARRFDELRDARSAGGTGEPEAGGGHPGAHAPRAGLRFGRGAAARHLRLEASGHRGARLLRGVGPVRERLWRPGGSAHHRECAEGGPAGIHRGAAHLVPRDPGGAEQHRPACPGHQRGGVGGAGRWQHPAAHQGQRRRHRRAGLVQAQCLRPAGRIRTGCPPRWHAAYARRRGPRHDAGGRRPHRTPGAERTSRGILISYADRGISPRTSGTRPGPAPARRSGSWRR
jgi:PAS domain S-box-containing protein